MTLYDAIFYTITLTLALYAVLKATRPVVVPHVHFEQIGDKLLVEDKETYSRTDMQLLLSRLYVLQRDAARKNSRSERAKSQKRDHGRFA